MAVVSPRSTAPSYPSVRIDHHDASEHRRELAERINDINKGKINVVSSVTLTISVTSTTLNDTRIGPNSFIGLMPTTANAAAALSTTYVSSRGDQTATITHANNAQADRTFVYAVLG